MTNKRRPVVAIDGPAGAGKSTVAGRVAARLGFALINTGALYRAAALLARRQSLSWDNGPGVATLLARSELRFDSEGRLHLLGPEGDELLGVELHSPEISSGASQVSRHPEVREALLMTQRQAGRDGGVVMEGRDIGTVVFPDAELKVFLTASPEARAERRAAELRERGEAADEAQVLEEIRERDERDRSREVAPLVPARDAHLLDTTELGIDEAVERILAHLARRADGGPP